MNMKKALGIILLILAIGILFFVFNNEKSDGNIIGEKRLAELASNDSVSAPLGELSTLNALEYTEEEAVGHFIKVGFSWKSIADVTKENADYEYAIEAYKKAETLSTDTNILPTNNIGVIYEILEKYDLAEQQYLRALEMSPVEYDTNKKLFDLYRYKLDKDSTEIIALLDKALETAVEQAPFLQLKAGYLKDIGQYQEALDIYESLVEGYPQFQVIIDELKAKLN